MSSSKSNFTLAGLLLVTRVHFQGWPNMTGERPVIRFEPKTRKKIFRRGRVKFVHFL